MSIRSTRTSKRIVAAIAAAGIAATTFAIASPVEATQTVVESRVGGLDRYATAALVAQATFTAPNANIILASGQNFPDGLAAAGLAGAANAPVLLTDPNALPGVTGNAMGAIFGTSTTKTVHIVGGESAVSAAVAAQVTSLGYTVNRIAGDNRYETAADIAAFQATLSPVGTTSVAGQTLRTAIVATGENFPDALAGGAPAFAGKHPVLLTASNSLPAATSAALTSLGVQRVILLGGETAVSAAVATEIAALGTGIQVTRIAGANRGETAQLLGNVLVASLAAGGFNFYGAAASPACLGTGVTGPNIGLIVNGSGFADALAAGPHAGVCKAPILLAGSPATAAFMTANSANVGVVRAIGGTSAVSAADLTAAATAATLGTPTTMLTINEGSAVVQAEFNAVITTAGSVKVNNAGAAVCPVTLATATPAALAAGTCYLVTTPGTTTTKLLYNSGANLVPGDNVVVSGFKTTATTTVPAVTAATATMAVPATATLTTLTASIGGGTVGSTAATVTFRRPVTLLAAADAVQITSTGGTSNVGPMTFATATDSAIGQKGTTIAFPALKAGDIIKVNVNAAQGIKGATDVLAAPVTLVVPSAGAAPSVTTAKGVLTEVGGVLNTTGALATNVVVQAKSALPAGAIQVEYVLSAAGTNIATSATAALNNVTGITTVTVTLGRDAGGVINATSAKIAAAINAGAGSVVTAVASDPTSLTLINAAYGPVGLSIGTRSLAVTATASKALNTVNAALIGYDGNADGFDDLLGAPTVAFTPLSNTFVATFSLGVGTTGAKFTPGTSQLRLAANALQDTTLVNSAVQIIAVTA